jgi:hypothetical protein
LNTIPTLYYPLTATDGYSCQILLFPLSIQNMSLIFIMVLRTCKSSMRKDVMAVKRLIKKGCYSK